MKLIIISIVLNAFIFVVNGQTTNQGPLTPSDILVPIGYFNDCEGSDAANYILHGIQSPSTGAYMDYLIQYTNQSNQRSVIPLRYLANLAIPIGEFLQSENLSLAIGGALQGKYVYEKTISWSAAYLKKRSSILGYSFITSKTTVIVINPKLDLNIFLAPTGAFEAFKRGNTTICKGRFYAF